MLADELLSMKAINLTQTHLYILHISTYSNTEVQTNVLSRVTNKTRIFYFEEYNHSINKAQRP